MSDKVSHPEHYNYAEIECIDVIKAATSELTGVEAFCIGNAIKYLWRYKHKNGKEDLKKARWYLNYAISNSESSESGVAFGYPYNDSESVPACQTDCKYLKDTIIQFRHSGIRAKRPTYFPTLVAINNTPIIWDKVKQKYRKITPREAANLQSFKKSFKFGKSDEQTYKQLGNAVNVKIIKILAKKLIGFAKNNWEDQ